MSEDHFQEWLEAYNKTTEYIRRENCTVLIGTAHEVFWYFRCRRGNPHQLVERYDEWREGLKGFQPGTGFAPAADPGPIGDKRIAFSDNCKGLTRQGANRGKPIKVWMALFLIRSMGRDEQRSQITMHPELDAILKLWWERSTDWESARARIASMTTKQEAV